MPASQMEQDPARLAVAKQASSGNLLQQSSGGTLPPQQSTVQSAPIGLRAVQQQASSAPIVVQSAPQVIVPEPTSPTPQTVPVANQNYWGPITTDQPVTSRAPFVNVPANSPQAQGVISIVPPAGQEVALGSIRETNTFVGPVQDESKRPYVPAVEYAYQPSGTNKKLSELNRIGMENQIFINAQKQGKISNAEYNTAINFQYERAREIEPTIPEGMIVTGITQKDSLSTLNLEPLKYAANVSSSNSFFGPVTGYFDKNNQFNAEIAQGVHGEKFYQISPPKDAPKGMNYAENRALTGLTLSTSLAMPLTAGSVKAAGYLVGTGFAGVGVAEGAKYGITGQHLTSDEAINAFGMGEVAGLGLKAFNSKVVQPRVAEGLSKSYGETLDSGDLWQPSMKEQALMKLTGAKPNSPVLVSRTSDLLTGSYDANAKANIELLQTDGYRNVPFGTEPDLEVKAAMGQMDVQGNPWIPSVKEAEMIRVTGAQVKPLAQGTVTAKVFSEDNLSFKGLQRGAYAEEDFDMAFAPKSSLQTTYERPTIPTQGLPKRMPIYFGLGTPTQTESLKGTDIYKYNSKEPNPFAVTEQPLEKGIPENILEYDYQGPLSFKKPTAFEQIAGLQDSSPTKAGGGMKPLWESQGSKPQPDIEFSKSPISQVAIQEGKTSIMRGSTPNMGETTTVQTTRQSNNPFTGFAGKSYYSQLMQEPQEEEIFLSTPNSGLMHPPQPKSIVDVVAVQRTRQTPMFDLSNPNQTSLLNLGLSEIAISKTNQSSMPNVGVAQGLKQWQDIVAIPTQATILAPATIQTPRTTTTPQPYDYPQVVSAKSPFTFPGGSKYEGSPFNLSSFKVGGLNSRKRVYPILSGEDVLKL